MKRRAGDVDSDDEDGAGGPEKRRKMQPDGGAPPVAVAVPVPRSLQGVPEERLAEEMERYNVMMRMMSRLRHPYLAHPTHPQDQKQLAYWANVFTESSERVTLPDPPVQHIAPLLRYKGRQYQHPSHVVCHLIASGVLVARDEYVAPLHRLRGEPEAAAPAATILGGFPAARADFAAAVSGFASYAGQVGAWGVGAVKAAVFGGASAGRPERIERRGDYVNSLVVMRQADALYERLKAADVARGDRSPGTVAAASPWEAEGLFLPTQVAGIAAGLNVHRSDLEPLLAFLQRSGKVQAYPGKDGGWGVRVGGAAQAGDAAAIHLQEVHADLHRQLKEKRAELKRVVGVDAPTPAAKAAALKGLSAGKKAKAALILHSVKTLDERIFKLEQLKESVSMARVNADSLTTYRAVTDEISRMTVQHGDASDVVASAAEAVAASNEVDAVLAQPLQQEDPDELEQLERELAELSGTPAPAAPELDALAQKASETPIPTHTPASVPASATPVGTLARVLHRAKPAAKQAAALC